MAGDLAAPYLSIVKAWEAERGALLAAYSEALGSGDRSGLGRVFEEASERVDITARYAVRQMLPAIQRIEQWHRLQWLSRIKAATGLDVSLFTSAADVAPEVESATVWNEQLAFDVNAQTKSRIATALMAGAAVTAPATKAAAKERQAAQAKVASEEAAGTGEATTTRPFQPSIEEQIDDAIGKARRRAKNIGVDQAEKTSASMTRGRRQSAGITSWRWRHYDPQPHPRIEHIRRDGRIYSDSRPPPTQCGEEPYCKCWEEPILR
jgi:uncharacterized protein with gpF-like domain